MRVHLDPVRWRLAQFRRFRVSKYFGTEVEMFPAARKGDPITHDMLVPCGVIGPPISGPCPGFGPVIIEGLPAAHVLCTVICTGVISAGIIHPPLPVPPPIVKGSMTVFIHGMPA